MPKKKKGYPKIVKKNKGNFSIVFFILGAGVVFSVVLGYVLFSKPTTPIILTNTAIAEFVNSSTVIIPDENTRVQLENGSGVVGPDGSGYVNMEEPYFSVKTTSGYDVFAVMNYNLGGSGVFAAIAVYQVENGVTTFKGSFPVGDRVPVTEITGPISSDSGNYTLSVTYLDRTETQSMADTPETPKTLEVQISNHQIVSG